jgi:hypothetical protein
MRVLTPQSSPADAGTLFLPMRISNVLSYMKRGVLSETREPPASWCRFGFTRMLGSTSNGLL